MLHNPIRASARLSIRRVIAIAVAAAAPAWLGLIGRLAHIGYAVDTAAAPQSLKPVQLVGSLDQRSCPLARPIRLIGTAGVDDVPLNPAIAELKPQDRHIAQRPTPMP
jgi:hypothetical protein